ncbi:MAG: hypothetical protein LBE13_02845 [Bacteroidales bacterium]|nr:hypothetical protein [Bacteroidales bacterium]
MSLQIHDNLDISFFYIVNAGIIINFILLLTNKKGYYKKVSLEIPRDVYKYNIQRKNLLYIFYLILLLSGIYIGVTTGLLSGSNVEDLRRKNEIGIGFIRDIPTAGINIIILVLILQHAKSPISKASIICFIYGFISFMSTGHKASFGTGLVLFICFFNLKYRGFKLYEYFLYYFSIPMGAAVLQTIRGGNWNDFSNNITTFYTYSTVLFEVNTIPIVNKINELGYVWGQEYYSALVKIIPRFIWNDKPLDFGYYYKELIEYSFEGGGTPIPTIFSLYVNFGYWFILFYLLWNLLLIKLYVWFCNENIYYYYRIIILTILLTTSSIALFIGKIEVVLLFLFICTFIYRKKYVI